MGRQHAVNINCIKEAIVATVTSPIGLWTTVLNPRVWHFGQLTGRRGSDFAITRQPCPKAYSAFTQNGTIIY